MTPPTYHAKRGASLVIPLEAVGASDGDLAIVTGVDAGLKPAPFQKVPAAEVARLAEFAIATRAAAGDVGPGWTLSLTAAQTAELPPGSYAVDARLTLTSGAVVITEPLLIRLDEVVTA